MKKSFHLTVFLLLCALQSGFFFQTGNLNKEYDETTLGPRIVLTFLGMKYAVVNEELSEALLSIYTGKHADVLVSYESLPPEQYYRLLQRRIRTDSLDDVFMVWSGDVRAYQQKGILLNLENLPALSSYRQEVLEQMRIDGRISFIPISLSAYAMYCNKNLLKEYGVEEPQNGAELLAACETFRKQGIQPIIADMESLKALVLLRSLFGNQQNSNVLFDKANKDPIMLQALLQEGFAFLALLRDREYIDSLAPLLKRTDNSDLLFALGEQPFMLGGIWLSPGLEGLIHSFSFRMIPYAILDDGPAIVLGMDTPLAVNAQSHHPEEARSLMESLTSARAINLFVRGQGLLSPRMDDPSESARAVSSFQTCLASGRVLFRSDTRLHYPLWKNLDKGVEMVLNGAAPEHAAAAVIQQLSLPQREDGQ